MFQERMGRYFSWRKGILGFIAVALFLLLSAGQASAHKVMVFAWVEGDTVHTESKFSGGKLVKKGEIAVYDAEGNCLVKGNTDERGEFSFRVPKKSTLKIVLNAGMGHRAEWTIPVDEIDTVAPEKAAVPIAHKSKTNEFKKDSKSKQDSKISPGELQMAIERALDKKLKPIMKILAESREQRPKLTEILGGIGYILGLLGIATYFHYRRRSVKPGREKTDRSEP